MLLPDDPTSLLDKMIPTRKLYLILFVTALCVKGLHGLHWHPLQGWVGVPKDCSEAKLGCSPLDMLPLALCAGDGKTYMGLCALMKANCLSQAWGKPVVSIMHLGSCPPGTKLNPWAPCNLEKVIGPCKQVFQLNNDLIR